MCLAVTSGVRRDVATITQSERNRLRGAIITLGATKYYADGVSYWDKQAQIGHRAGELFCPSFLAWVRELCNRFEGLLREVDPTLSLHYWNWTTDPRACPTGDGGVINLLSTGPTGFMGSAYGPVGPPFNALTATRDLAPGPPVISHDAELFAAGDGAPQADQHQLFREAAQTAYAAAREYVGGTIATRSSALEDPFAMLILANVDRLFAMWQQMPEHPWRLDPARLYGIEGTSAGPGGVMSPLEPWAGGAGLRPWAAPENRQYPKTAKHATIVTPPLYDTSPIWTESGRASTTRPRAQSNPRGAGAQAMRSAPSISRAQEAQRGSSPEVANGEFGTPRRRPSPGVPHTVWQGAGAGHHLMSGP